MILLIFCEQNITMYKSSRFFLELHKENKLKNFVVPSCVFFFIKFIVTDIFRPFLLPFKRDKVPFMGCIWTMQGSI